MPVVFVRSIAFEHQILASSFWYCFFPSHWYRKPSIHDNVSELVLSDELHTITSGSGTSSQMEEIVGKLIILVAYLIA